jgi:geranylgeranyl diphosphate synthase type I
MDGQVITQLAADVRTRVGCALEEFLADYTQVLRRVGDELADLDDVLETSVLGGGKRLRPQFAYWGARAAGAADDEALIRAAASLELLHAFALVHDDLMDASDTRRGRPSAHRVLEHQHRTVGWHGDAEHFGQSVAILLGDLLLVLSEQMLTTAGLPAAALERARAVSAGMRLELMAGQYLDIAAQARGTGSVGKALRIAQYKSGKYTVEAPLHLGGAVAGAPARITDAYTAFALPLGEAFQLRDDVLGVFGDCDLTGKPSGEDLREGKRTALVALALEKGTGPQRTRLEAGLGDPLLDTDGVQVLREILTDTGALATVETMIHERANRAAAVLDSAPLTQDGREALRDLAAASADRVS